MITKSVAVSGTAGKQVYFVASGNILSGRRSVVLKGFLLSPLSAKARVTIRSGNASGSIEYEAAAPSGQSIPVLLPKEGQRFDQGMHVKVLGASAVCYLYVD